MNKELRDSLFPKDYNDPYVFDFIREFMESQID